MSKAPRNVRTAPARSEPAEAESPRPPAAKGDGKGAWRSRLAKVGAAVRTVLGVAIVLGASAGVAWGARRYVTTSPRFSVKAIEVQGASRLAPEDVARAGGIAVGDNVFAVDLEEARRDIEAEPWVKSASVTRKLPGSIMVKVTEHEPAALVSIGETLYLVSRAGDIFKEVAAEDPFDFPVVTGLAAEDVANDREGTEKKLVRALDLVAEAQKSPALSRHPVQEVHLERDGTVSLVVGREAIVIALGLPPYKGKLEQAERVFAELGKRKGEASMIFLDNEGSPERVVVRMR